MADVAEVAAGLRTVAVSDGLILRWNHGNDGNVMTVNGRGERADSAV